MHGQYGMMLVLTESYDANLTRTMGGITTNGCMYMNDAQGSSGINETKYWTYFGDPTVPIRTAPSTSMNVVHDDVIIIGSSEFLISTGSEGDLVALSRDGELLASGYTNSFGNVNLELGDAATIPGELDFVATGFNNFPYEALIMVGSNQNGDVNLDGQINIQDIIVTVNITLDIYEPTAEQYNIADINNDGEVNILDIVQLVNIILGN